MSLTKASDICKPLEGSGLLEKPMPISLLDEIAYHLEEWEELAPYIELTEAEQEEIKNDYDKQYLLQKRQALRRWRKKGHLNATLETFVSILCKQGLISLAEMVIKKSKVPPSCLLIFAKYLQHFYIHDFHHPANNQWPSLLEGFDLPALYVDLKFNKVPLNETKGAQSKAVEVELKEVFQEKATNRLVILFEGIAGSGKTTLSWHACREWADKKLLQQFDLLIHVQLNDPRLQNASSLRDLIPDPDKEARDEIAQAITDREGKGACVLLEGLDEASKSLRDFILTKMLHDKRLSRLSIIITSRPDSKLLLSLQKCLSTRIVLNGFTSQKLNEFLDSTMKEDEVGRGKLNKMFSIRPRFQALCTLPINAVVVSFLTQCFGHELPVTQTGLFNLLVCHICIRHMQLRSGGTDLHIERLPHDLPSDLRESFDKLCLLAYTASMKKKRAISLVDMKQVKFQEDVDNKLGILHISQTKSMYGLSKNYTFPHFALQQFLAAVHMSCHDGKTESCVKQIIQDDPLDKALPFYAGLTSLSAESCVKQIMEDDPLDEVLPYYASRTSLSAESRVKQIIEDDPLDEVLPFYAGLTSLSNNESRKVMFDVLKLSLDSRFIAEQLKNNPTASNDPRRRALALFRCLYECQEESRINEARLSCDPAIDSRHAVSFQDMWLSPLECLAVGYFVRHKSMSMPEGTSLSLFMTGCCISDTSISVLTREIKRNINTRTPCGVKLLLGANKFSSYETLMSLKNLLKGQSNIEGIGLPKCFEKMDMKIVLKHIIEGLHSNSSCREIQIGYNGINESHIYHLVLMILACPQLQVVNLSSCSLSSVMPFVAKAISLSKLIAVHLSNCDMDDDMLKHLAKEIPNSPYLSVFEMYGTPITPGGLSEFVSSLSTSKSNVQVVKVDPILCLLFNTVYVHVLNCVNDKRKQTGRTELHVTTAQQFEMLNAQGSNYISSRNDLSRKK